MSDSKFPYTGWVLTASKVPKSLTFIREGRSWGAEMKYNEAENGKAYLVRDIFRTQECAFEAGLAELNVQQQKLDKLQSNLDKRQQTYKAALAKFNANKDGN